MIRKYLKKSTALTIAICTLVTSCTLNINGKEKMNIKQNLKYLIPSGFALVAGCILGNAYSDRLRQSDRISGDNVEKYSETLECIKNIKDFRKLPALKLNAYMDEMINNPLKCAKFGSFEHNKILIFRKFYEENTLDKAWFLEELQKGTTMVFLGNIINDKNDNGISLRNLIFLTTLQKLYPNNVIILKGLNETDRRCKDELPISISSYMRSCGIYNKNTVKQMRSLLDNLMCACEISHEGSDGKEFRCLFSYQPVKFKMIENEPVRRNRLELTRQNFIDGDFEEGDFMYTKFSIYTPDFASKYGCSYSALKGLNEFLKKEGYEKFFCSTRGHKLEMIYLNDLLRYQA